MVQRWFQDFGSSITSLMRATHEIIVLATTSKPDNRGSGRKYTNHLGDHLAVKQSVLALG